MQQTLQKNFKRLFIMLGDLLEFSTRNKTELLRKLEQMREASGKYKVKRHWIHYTPKSQDGKNIAAEDGSINYVEFKSFVLYAAAGEAVGYIDKSLQIEKNFDIDFLKPYKYTSERLRFYMAILEKKAALRLLHKHKDKIDLLLLDGSIIGDLIRPAAYAYHPTKEIRERINNTYLDELKEQIGRIENTNLVYSKRFSSEIYEKFDKHALSAMVYLEYIENFLTILELLKFGDKIVGISKTSRSNNYFHDSDIPDMAIFEKTCRVPGFSTPIKIELVDDRYKRVFPILEDVLRTLDISIFYARFRPNTTTLRFEYIGREDKERAKKILDILESNIVEGYPYLLRKAHREVKITDLDMYEIIKSLGVLEKTGREML